MIEKPCFFSTTETINISACTPSCVVFRVDKTMSWDACKHGKLDPLYANWQRMTEQAAAGPWRTDVENAPGYQKVLIRMCDGSGRSSYVCIGQCIDGNWSRNTGEPMPDGLTPIAFAEINTEGL